MKSKKCYSWFEQGGRKSVPCPLTSWKGSVAGWSVAEPHLGQAWAPWALTRMTAGLTLKPIGSAWAPLTATLMTWGTMLIPGQQAPIVNPELLSQLAPVLEHATSAGLHEVDAGAEDACTEVRTDSCGGRAHHVLADQARSVVEENCTATQARVSTSADEV